MSHLYFIRPVDHEGPIKIGYSSYPEGRIAAFMPGSPLRLELIASVPATYVHEHIVQHHFRHLLSHNEWFNAAPELSAFIEALRTGKPLGELVDLTKKPAGRRYPLTAKPVTA